MCIRDRTNFTPLGDFNIDYTSVDPSVLGGLGYGNTESSNSGGGFEKFLNSEFMSNVGGPLLAAGLSGGLMNRAAANYRESAREAAYAAGLAGRDIGAFGLLGEEAAQRRRQKDAAYQLALQRGPFQTLAAKEGAMKMMAQGGPSGLAGQFMAKFG